MKKRALLVLWGCLLAQVLGLGAAAGEETGGIRVTMPSEGAGVLTLYQVGEEIEGGYRILEAFGGGAVEQEDALSPHFAKLLAGVDVQGGWSQTMDKENSAEFNYLPRGLYLLVQSQAEAGAAVVRPFLLSVPMDGQWYVRSYPDPQPIYLENPRTGQHPGPILGAVGMVVTGVALAVCAGSRRRK